MVGETTQRRRGLLLIGFISVAILILVGPNLFTIFTTFPGQKEVIYSSPGESISLSNGEWFARAFMIDDNHGEIGVGVEGVLFSHNKNEDNIVLEFGYAYMSLTSFMSLNDTEMMDSFEGYGSGGSWGPLGTEYASGYFSVDFVGEYVWAIRFIDSENSSAVFETDFEICLQPM